MLRALKGRRGSAIAEALIAVLIIAGAVAAVFGAVLGGFAELESARMRSMAVTETENLIETLENYSTADPSMTAGAPGDPPWHLPGDSCPGQSASCWALSSGAHDVTATLPEALRVSPYSAKMTYTVSNVVVGSELSRRVTVSFEWADRKP